MELLSASRASTVRLSTPRFHSEKAAERLLRRARLVVESPKPNGVA
jgi:hypothetical protein